MLRLDALDADGPRGAATPADAADLRDAAVTGRP
jgi:hypothetical protein